MLHRGVHERDPALTYFIGTRLPLLRAFSQISSVS